MTIRYLSENAYIETFEYLAAAGYAVCRMPAAGSPPLSVSAPVSGSPSHSDTVSAAPVSAPVAGSPSHSDTVPAPPVSASVADHADLFCCRLGIADDAPVIHAQPGDLAPGYPQEAAFNAVCTGRFFLHHPGVTNPRLLAAAEDFGQKIIHARQGYTRCSTIPVSESALITYDRGIAIPAEKAGLDVLLIEPGHVLLPGYDSGFLGGTCGNLQGRTLLFNGDLTAHPDFRRITEFAESYGLTCRWIPEKPLRDIGSII